MTEPDKIDAERGIGVVTGRGLLVVDCDVKGAEDGRATLRELFEQHGEPPPTPTAFSGSGGTHYWFRAEGTTPRTTTRKLGPGIDTRGDGGQVVVPPSPHECGMPYTWHNDELPPPLAKLPVTPPFLLELLNGRGATAPRPTQPLPPADRREAGLAAAIDRALQLIPADDYDTWLQIGQALHSGGHPLEIWESWSRKSDKYEPDACEAKWSSFTGDRGITMGTFWHLAQEHGYRTQSAVYAATRDWAADQAVAPDRDTAASYARTWNQEHSAGLDSDEARDAGRRAAQHEASARANTKRNEFAPPADPSDEHAGFALLFDDAEEAGLDLFENINRYPRPPYWRVRTKHGEETIPTLNRFPTARDKFGNVGLDIKPEYTTKAGWRFAVKVLRACATKIYDPIPSRASMQELLSMWFESSRFYNRPRIERIEPDKVAFNMARLVLWNNQHRRFGDLPESAIRDCARDAGAVVHHDYADWQGQTAHIITDPDLYAAVYEAEHEWAIRAAEERVARGENPE